MKPTIFEKYPTYKDSEKYCIGKTPTNWEVIKLKFVCNIFNGDSLNETLKKKFSSDNLDDLAYISSKDINVNDASVNYENGLRIPKKAGYKVAPKGSVLLCIEGGSAGKKITFTNEDVCFVNKLACFKSTDKIDNKYIFYLIKSKPFITQFNLSMSGLIGGVAISLIKNFDVNFPPLPEQTAIANFLDEKTAKIDLAIAQKERLIELLQERKQIIIQQAVTKGLPAEERKKADLDMEVEMKDSGVEWIGEIPKHWEVRRFKNLFTQSKLTPRKGDGTVTSYRDGQVTLRSNRRLTGYTEAILENGFQGVRKGQLVLNSMDAFEGAIGVSDSDGKCTPEYIVCNKIKSRTSNYYFAYLLREMALSKYILVIGGAVRQRAVRIRFNSLAKRFMVTPPSEEQDKIVDYIQKESEKIERGVFLLENQIAKLKEYKATLIDSAVTGKIKVG